MMNVGFPEQATTTIHKPRRIAAPFHRVGGPTSERRGASTVRRAVRVAGIAPDGTVHHYRDGRQERRTAPKVAVPSPAITSPSSVGPSQPPPMPASGSTTQEARHASCDPWA